MWVNTQIAHGFMIKRQIDYEATSTSTDIYMYFIHHWEK